MITVEKKIDRLTFASHALLDGIGTHHIARLLDVVPGTVQSLLAKMRQEEIEKTGNSEHEYPHQFKDITVQTRAAKCQILHKLGYTNLQIQSLIGCCEGSVKTYLKTKAYNLARVGIRIEITADLISFLGDFIQPGIYFLRLETGDLARIEPQTDDILDNSESDFHLIKFEELTEKAGVNLHSIFLWDYNIKTTEVYKCILPKRQAQFTNI